MKEVDILAKPKVLIGAHVPIEVEEYIGKHCEYEKFADNETITYEKLLKKLGVRYSELNTLLNESDLVVVLVALSDETHHMIGREEFRMMKKKGILIINELANWRALLFFCIISIYLIL
jgi:lactate dehydrogenase-like 2-hydroxyacid dehydrogenase